ncbi:GTP 3',8-cyclase MoaA [Oscillospiraceae bacterium PP1C4]
MTDKQNRNIDYLRISVTDRCNLRCVYCMPAEGVEPVAHSDILTFEEILRICKSAAVLGIRKIKLTGGEPLVRKGVVGLVRNIKSIDGIEQVTMTTNGILLGGMADELKAAGLDAVNISLDTLDSVQFGKMTRREGLEQVLAAIDHSLELGMHVKINCVPIKELGEEQIVSMASLAKDRPLDVRFIELMPIGLGSAFTGVSTEEIKRVLARTYGELIPYNGVCGNGPASYLSIAGFAGKIGFISAISDRFCANCNRIRLTATGFLKLCLHYDQGIDLRGLLRSGVTDEELTRVIEQGIHDKPLRHHFGESAVAHEETHKMVQIGG